MSHILLTANTAWYMANFRSSLILELQKRGHRVSVLVPNGPGIERLKGLGCELRTLRLNSTRINPLSDFVLFFAVSVGISSNQARRGFKLHGQK